jgi:16S rRNA (cytidine1402-2'-O)-methyltransferase
MSAENPPVGSKLHGRLLVCATPIGNLDDVTLRVLDALRAADVLACEDTRHTQILLARHDIVAARLVSLHEHNERARASELAARVRAGETVALVSDAGTPLISDPGFALVQACIQAGLPVEVLPGPSAVLSALVASGLPAERWCFVGFLPRKRAERERLFEHPRPPRHPQPPLQTLVAFESPRRLAATLAQLAERDPQRPLAVCRELTKLHEEVRRGTAAELAEHYAASAPRGEVVLVVGAAGSGAAGSGAPGSAHPTDPGHRADALQALRELLDAGARPRPAAKVVAKLTGLSANELYRDLTTREPDPSGGGQ